MILILTHILCLLIWSLLLLSSLLCFGAFLGFCCLSGFWWLCSGWSGCPCLGCCYSGNLFALGQLWICAGRALLMLSSVPAHITRSIEIIYFIACIFVVTFGAWEDSKDQGTGTASKCGRAAEWPEAVLNISWTEAGADVCHIPIQFTLRCCRTRFTTAYIGADIRL